MTVSTRSKWQLALVAALLAAACSESARAPVGLSTSSGGKRSVAAPANGGEEPAGGATSSNGGETGDAGQAPSAGAPSGGAGAGGAGHDGAGHDGVAGAADGGEPSYVEPLPDPTCLGVGELSGAVKLAISTAGIDQFGSITPDERVIAWTVVDAGKVVLHYSRRESAGDDFGAPSTLELVEAADDAVTLAADGLRVVYTRQDRKGFTQLVRAAVDEPFVDVDSRDFVPIGESGQELAEGELFGDPVLGPEDSTFFYSRYGAQRRTTLLGTLRFSNFAPWPAGTELPLAPSLEGVEDDRPRPTAISLDRQTLFLWNSETSTQIVAMLSHETSKYEAAFELGDARGAAPNAACSRIFYDRDGDLWTAELR